MARKNVAMAMPWTRSGSTKWKKSAWAVKFARIRNETPKAIKATVAMMRASILLINLADSEGVGKAVAGRDGPFGDYSQGEKPNPQNVIDPKPRRRS